MLLKGEIVASAHVNCRFKENKDCFLSEMNCMRMVYSGKTMPIYWSAARSATVVLYRFSKDFYYLCFRRVL